MDQFLARVFEKYEIILFTQIKKGDEAHEIDPGNLYVTHSISNISDPSIPKHWWKWIKLLDRPEYSTIVVDVNPDNTITNPDSTVIVKEWDGVNLNDKSLVELENFLDYVAKRVVSGTSGVKEICPQFHDIDADLVELWATKKQVWQQ